MKGEDKRKKEITDCLVEKILALMTPKQGKGGEYSIKNLRWILRHDEDFKGMDNRQMSSHIRHALIFLFESGVVKVVKHGKIHRYSITEKYGRGKYG